ncbi:hypothetical protein FB1_23410 [Flavobacterium branchiophilum NBRC 15030 = ATCC 35035]|nr:hypothetical protein FB1_23410 [Flavobacterium branchiophilum NBRC 15030 = ATCC 35035]
MDYLNPLATIHNSFLFHINTCAYYANKENPTLQIKAYPDVVWIGHFQYNGEEKPMDYFFHDKKFDLEQGITTALNELKKTVFYKIWRIIPANFIMEQTVIKYIEDQAKSYIYGIDTIHDRTLEKTGEELSLVGTHTNLLTQTQYTKYAAAAVIYEFVVIGIIIDLLIIYLTRGKSLEGRILKLANNLKKAQQYIKLMEDAGIEIIPPSIAINAGMYYKKQNDGRLALVYEANLKADPLVALNYKKEFDLLSLITKGIENIKGAKHPKDKKVKEKLERNKENNNSIVEHFKSICVPTIKGSIDVTGSILFEKKIQYNLLTNTYTFTDKLGNLVQTAYNEVIIKKQIDFNTTIKGKFDGKFEFFRLETSFEGKVDFTLKGSTGIKLSYGLDNKGGRGLFVSKSLYCSGVEGTYLGSLKVKGSLGDILDWSSNEGKPTPFTLIEPFEVPFFDIQLFKS